MRTFAPASTLEQFENDILFGRHMTITEVNRSQSAKEMRARGLPALKEIGEHLRTRFFSSHEHRLNVPEAWILLICMIAEEHKLVTPLAGALETRSRWADFCLADHSRQKPPSVSSEYISVTSRLPDRIMKVNCMLSWKLPGCASFAHPEPFIFCPVKKTFRRWKNNRNMTKYVTAWKPA